MMREIFEFSFMLTMTVMLLLVSGTATTGCYEAFKQTHLCRDLVKLFNWVKARL